MTEGITQRERGTNGQPLKGDGRTLSCIGEREEGEQVTGKQLKQRKAARQARGGVNNAAESSGR
jgi:hypothetical protein